MIDRFRDFIRQPSMRAQLRELLAEVDQLRPADAAVTKQEQARRHIEAAAAYRVLLGEDESRNRAADALDRAYAAEIARLREREQAIRWAAHERTIERLQRSHTLGVERATLEAELRDTAPTALQEALAEVRALDNQAEREDRRLGPLSGRWLLLREQRAACDAAYRQLDELLFLGLDDQQASQRVAAILEALRRTHDEIGRRPVPVLDEALCQAIRA